MKCCCKVSCTYHIFTPPLLLLYYMQQATATRESAEDKISNLNTKLSNVSVPQDQHLERRIYIFVIELLFGKFFNL